MSEKYKTSQDQAKRKTKYCQQPSQTLLNSCLADHFSFPSDYLLFFPSSSWHWSQEYDCPGITLMIMHFLYFNEQSMDCFKKKRCLQIFQMYRFCLMIPLWNSVFPWIKKGCPVLFSGVLKCDYAHQFRCVDAWWVFVGENGVCGGCKGTFSKGMVALCFGYACARVRVRYLFFTIPPLHSSIITSSFPQLYECEQVFFHTKAVNYYRT